MLSRVAERLYWSARYLERVENTARLVSVYDDLLFDLPKDIKVSWYNLIEILSGEEGFEQRYKVKDERNVVKFLLADDTNSSSMLSSLKMVRENIRTTRDVVPKETWELINELDLYAQQNIKQGINRSERHLFLNTIIEGCQKIIGLFAGAMSRDCGWHFLIMGRYLERADMGTRILDAAVSLMLESEPEARIQLGQVTWSKVLKSQSAYMDYRRTIRTSINGAKAVTFLMNDPCFPRTLAYCFGQIGEAATKLPRAGLITAKVDKILQFDYPLISSEDLDEDFHNHLNDLQIAIIDINHQITQNWFHFRQGDAA
ncbi:alpha-E domain-containing protein [Marinomonas sp. M1K-6]|uniref:Alpha-E domain-containing protein n=1 Tax=Marinomonas profundi TaxID=2726122 RepID=A0A847RBR9_9GAMM|nr:alpha-E domain-containing protein [Marinomonas profundi]NLQ17660.1 alpha-E domain-containing protein [Marinomonas profundi]UDV02124.1 alpha-E domain-containing protein [Marinomonas profundi]